MTTKVKPSSPGQLQCQTLESPCWCPGCCSFQRPDFTSWVIRPSNHILYMIYHIWLRRDLSDQLLVRRETSTGSRSCVQFAEKPFGAIVLVLRAAPPKQYLSWCPFEILTQPWRSCRSARRQGRTRWKHSRPLRRSSKQELWRGRRQSKKAFLMSQLFVIDSQKMTTTPIILRGHLNQASFPFLSCWLVGWSVT